MAKKIQKVRKGSRNERRAVAPVDMKIPSDYVIVYT
jgi:hypothetical protein